MNSSSDPAEMESGNFHVRRFPLFVVANGYHLWYLDAVSGAVHSIITNHLATQSRMPAPEHYLQMSVQTTK